MLLLDIYKRDTSTHYVLKERPIYGSTRVGVDYTKVELVGATLSSSLDTFATVLGNKQYELVNHLGNVITTVSDYKIPVRSVSDTTKILYGKAAIVTATDFYPYHSVMVGRSFSLDLYRNKGANGQENVNEMSGFGRHSTAEYWEYDPILGRRWNIDPEIRPWESPYMTFSGSPILLDDPDGLAPPDWLAKIFHPGRKHQGLTHAGINLPSFSKIALGIGQFLFNVKNSVSNFIAGHEFNIGHVDPMYSNSRNHFYYGATQPPGPVPNTFSSPEIPLNGLANGGQTMANYIASQNTGGYTLNTFLRSINTWGSPAFPNTFNLFTTTTGTLVNGLSETGRSYNVNNPGSIVNPADNVGTNFAALSPLGESGTDSGTNINAQFVTIGVRQNFAGQLNSPRPLTKLMTKQANINRDRNNMKLNLRGLPNDYNGHRRLWNSY